MAVIISEQEAVSRLNKLSEMFRGLASQRRQIGRYAKDLEDEGNTAEYVATTINAMLTDWDALRDQFVTELSAIPTTYKSVVRIGMPSRYNWAVVVANSQSNTNDLGEACGTIRACRAAEMDLVSPFSCFAAGDIVSISNAEDEDNNLSAKVQYTPATAGAEKITNGGFSSSSAWTESGDGGTEVTITGGKAVFSSATCTLSQAKADMVGGGWTNAVRYVVEFTLDTVSAGTLSVGTNTNTAQHVVTADGTHTAIILADNNAAGLIFTATGFTGNLDNVSVIPFTGIALNEPLYADNDKDSSIVISLEER